MANGIRPNVNDALDLMYLSWEAASKVVQVKQDLNVAASEEVGVRSC
jgi:hypothetical protein